MSLSSAFLGESPTPSSGAVPNAGSLPVGAAAFGPGAMRAVLPSKGGLDYARSLLEVLALVVAFAWFAVYAARRGPGAAAERLARGKLG